MSTQLAGVAVHRLLLVLLTLLLAAPIQGAEQELSATWWGVLEPDARTEIQADLILTGHYDAMVDGIFGPATYRAITDYQRSLGDTAIDGVLSPKELAKLHAAAAIVYDDLGFAVSHDKPGGVSAYVPRKLLTLVSETKDQGTTYSTADGNFTFWIQGIADTTSTFPDIEEALLDLVKGSTVTYHVAKQNRAVVSGTNEGIAFYAFATRDRDKVILFFVGWTPQYADVALKSAVFAASYSGQSDLFKPTPAAPSAPDATIVAQAVGEQIGPFVLAAKEPNVIRLNGDIEAGATLDLRRAMKMRPSANVLYLNSNGGSVNEGLLLAHAVADKGISTEIPSGMACLSACSYVFFAGKTRTAKGALGVHQIYGDGVTPEGAQVVLSDVLDALSEFGVSQEVVSVMLRTPPTDMHVFTDQEIRSLGINRSSETAGVAATVPAPAPEPTQPVPIESKSVRALLLEANDDPTKGATPFNGSVIWSEQDDLLGHPFIQAVAALPERNISVTLTFGKDTDYVDGRGAVADLSFSIPSSFPGGSIAGVPGILLKNEELEQGQPLVGTFERTRENTFRVKLSDKSAEAQANAKLLTSNKWMDVALIYASGRRAILTLEIDEAASAAFAPALRRWHADNAVDLGL